MIADSDSPWRSDGFRLGADRAPVLAQLEFLLAAVGGINELMLARVERGETDRLPQDVDAATAVVVGILERRG